MINPSRLSKAFIQGRDSAIATRCSPERAELRYHRGTAEYMNWNAGWNSIFSNFRKILTPSSKAQKV